MCIKTQNIYTLRQSEESVVIGKRSKLNPSLSKDPPSVKVRGRGSIYRYPR